MDKLNVKLFDVVLIDGRAELIINYKVLNYIDKGSIVFIHDFWHRAFNYHKVFEWYDEVVSIKDTQQGDGGLNNSGIKEKMKRVAYVFGDKNKIRGLEKCYKKLKSDNVQYDFFVSTWDDFENKKYL